MVLCEMNQKKAKLLYNYLHNNNDGDDNVNDRDTPQSEISLRLSFSHNPVTVHSRSATTAPSPLDQHRRQDFSQQLEHSHHAGPRQQQPS